MNILTMSFQASVMIVVILLIRKTLWNILPKIAFPILWGIVLFRLLVPLTLSSDFSIYNIWRVEQKASEQIPAPIASEFDFEGRPTSEAVIHRPESQTKNTQSPSENRFGYLSGNVLIFSLLGGLWIIGAIFFFCFFLLLYFRNHKKIGNAVSAEHDPRIAKWKKQHCLQHRPAILESPNLCTPVSYGIFAPKIILPTGLDRQNTVRLSYILTHELCHILRRDALWKWLMVLAVCLHWWNPLVWVMLYFFNRDLEVSCDEMVLSRLSGEHRAEYAYTLLETATEKNGFSPLYNYFSKNAAKERITAIMKYKKVRIPLIILTIAIILMVGFVFATTERNNATENKSHTENNLPANSLFGISLSKPEASTHLLTNEDLRNRQTYTIDEIQLLESLLLPGLDHMTVYDFREKIHKLTDTPQYMNLLEKAAADEQLYLSVSDPALVEYLQYVFYPLTSEKWEKQFFNHNFGIRYEDTTDFRLEWSTILTITDAKALKVQDYYLTESEITAQIQKLVSERAKEYLLDAKRLNAFLDEKILEIANKYSKNGLIVEINYITSPAIVTKQIDVKKNKQEERPFPKATKEDYRSLLRLKENYKEMFLLDFNQKLSTWINDNEDISKRIDTDIAWNSVPTEMTPEEQDFIRNTYYYSGAEISAIHRSKHTGTAANAIFDIELPEKTDSEKRIWARINFSFSYQVFYHLSSHRITVAERDAAVNGLIGEARDTWNKMTTEEAIRFIEKKEDSDRWLTTLAQKYSSETIKLEITNNNIQYMNEEEIKK